MAETEEINLEGIRTFVLARFPDERGYLTPMVYGDIENELGVRFIQENVSKSRKNVIRGMHYQWDQPTGKLVRVLSGKVMDVVVDIREGSPTYGKWESVILSEDNNKVIWVPAGFAHGFISLEENSIMSYLNTARYNPKSDGCINPFCESINIDWGIEGKESIVSVKDKSAESFLDYKNDPKFYYGI
jgi:dTDP-4-dehydrorhamnose 3,5-epimerase